jgi:hypothetical protein
LVATCGARHDPDDGGKDATGSLLDPGALILLILEGLSDDARWRLGGAVNLDEPVILEVSRLGDHSKVGLQPGDSSDSCQVGTPAVGLGFHTGQRDALLGGDLPKCEHDLCDGERVLKER